MKRILMNFSYKGTNFCGYQKQNNKRTVQGEIEDCLKKVLKQDIVIHATGRTDAGVHAINQYAHFDCDINFDATKLKFSLNDNLPDDITINDTKEVDKNFHARFCVKQKTYMYVIKLGNVSPILRDLVTPIQYDLDFAKIDKIIPIIKGTHNFKAFCSTGSSVSGYERTIYNITYERVGDYVKFFVTGNGFLYNMVRIIIGTIIDVARGRIDNSTVEKMLETGERSLGGKTLSPNGLYLYNVEY